MRSISPSTIGLAALLAAALAACDGTPFTAPSAGPTLTPEATAASLTDVPGVVEIVGEAGPGSTYALLRPADWNGGLVVWAHGYIQPFQAVELPSGSEHLGAVRDHALEAGYGFAYASYSHNGYAVKDGAQRTHQLRGLFGDAFGPPDRTYLIGVSMGGLIVEMLSERYPAQYDGTLAACPSLDGLYNASYVASFRVLFDWFFQDGNGVSPLPGSLYGMPEGYYLIPPADGLPYGSPAFQAVYGAVTADEAAIQTAAVMASIEQIDLQLAPETYVSELVWSFLQVLGYQINGANVLTDLLNGHGFFDNSDSTYTSPLLDQDQENLLNHPVHGIERFSADPAGVSYLEQWWQPTGDLSNPFLTLHTTRDPLVPFRMEEMFRRKVEAAGNADLLVQRSFEAFGHCAYGVEAMVQAFDDLVLWVEDGVKPTP